MANLEVVARWVMFFGIGLLIAGALLWAISKIPGIEKFPTGMFTFQVGNVTCFFPILLSIVLSILLTIMLNIIVKMMNR
jgi:Protein of unknown function (DUF2905)